MICPERSVTRAELFQPLQASQFPLIFSNCPPVISSGSLGALFSGPHRCPAASPYFLLYDLDSTQTLCLAVLFAIACTLGSRAYTLAPSFATNVVCGFLILLSRCFYVGSWIWEGPKTMIPLPSSQDYPFLNLFPYIFLNPIRLHYSEMVGPTGWEMTATEKIVCYPWFPRRGHATPCRATWGSTRVGQEAERVRRKHRQEP